MLPTTLPSMGGGVLAGSQAFGSLGIQLGQVSRSDTNSSLLLSGDHEGQISYEPLLVRFLRFAPSLPIVKISMSYPVATAIANFVPSRVQTGSLKKPRCTNEVIGRIRPLIRFSKLSM